VKTLAHEIAHALLHESFDSRALAELEAESTTYVV
jgi:Zn-dependent peptidase ImmA (M78 family)